MKGEKGIAMKGHLKFVLPVVLSAVCGAAVAQDAATYTFALDSFRAHRYAAAYGRFARLADGGHAPSAQIALMMFRNGPALFGHNWDATPEQLQRWKTLVQEAERGRGADAEYSTEAGVRP